MLRDVSAMDQFKRRRRGGVLSNLWSAREDDQLGAPPLGRATQESHDWERIACGSTEKGRTMDHLWGLYERWCMEELISLREFVMRLKAGEFGTFNRADVVGLLREIEASVLENIELKASENPLLEELKEERMAETSQEIDELIADWDR